MASHDIVSFIGHRMFQASHNATRSISAVICLLAVLLLYTPLGAAAWSSYRSGCCAKGMCSIKEHHHQQPPAAPPQDQMDCGHHGAHMMSCSLSCCHNDEVAAAATAIFVLPRPFVRSVPAPLKSSIAFLQVSDSPQLLEPLSPPPRSSLAVA